jgi:hypothetical protein
MDGEAGMDIAGGPAALGGIMMGVALAAWSLGRWQGGLVSCDNRSAAAGEIERVAAGNLELHPPFAVATPCQTAARMERNVAMATALSLGDMHAEISAYRRAEQVLAGLTSDPLRLTEGRTGCRYLGVIGEPTCGVATAARLACACGPS